MAAPMKIITVPHPTLRQVAKPIEQIDARVIKLVKELGKTLEEKRNPPGVGLAAPQVDVLLRMFATKVGPDGDERNQRVPTTVFINPVIVKHSPKEVLGPNSREQTLEGCLSIPGLYGPVPRWDWITMQYQLLEGEQLVSQQVAFEGFHARVIQHEYDHLNGILFTDHSLRTGLPIYRDSGKELQEIEDRSFIELY
jgi:peptide deformylase